MTGRVQTASSAGVENAGEFETYVVSPRRPDHGAFGTSVEPEDPRVIEAIENALGA